MRISDWSSDVCSSDLHDLFLQSHRVIAASVERLRVHAAEVANARQRTRDQTVEKLVHPLAAKRHLAADRPAFAQLEAGDRLLGHGDDRLRDRDRHTLRSEKSVRRKECGSTYRFKGATRP